MTLHPSGRAARTAALVGFLLHCVTTLLAWWTWGEFGRGYVLAWIDFPISLFFMHLDGPPLLRWSLAAGGAQWAVIAWLLTLFLGSAVRMRQRWGPHLSGPPPSSPGEEGERQRSS